MVLTANDSASLPCLLLNQGYNYFSIDSLRNEQMISIFYKDLNLQC